MYIGWGHKYEIFHPTDYSRFEHEYDDDAQEMNDPNVEHETITNNIRQFSSQESISEEYTTDQDDEISLTNLHMNR
jgi:hypothetical protein